MMLRDRIKKDVAKAVSSVKYQVSSEDIEVTRTSDAKFGDYTTNVALKIRSSVLSSRSSDKQSLRSSSFGKLRTAGLSGQSVDQSISQVTDNKPGLELPYKPGLKDNNRKLKTDNKQSPQEIANKIADSLQNLPYVEKLEVAGPGFINFFVKSEVWQKEIENVVKERGTLLNKNAEKRRILVEYAHPNTHKLFHIGHLRNITTGESVSRLLEALGNKVIRVNYQGDVGLHIAKALWGFMNLKAKAGKTLDEKVELLAQAYREGNEAYESGQVEAIDEINKKLYEKDQEISRLWSETKSWSLEYFDRIYRRVGTHFDRLYFEGEVADLGKEEVLKFLKKGIFEESEGAIIFGGDKFGLHKRVFVNSKGFSTYEAKDVGLAKLQFAQYSPDLIIHVVAPEQTDYFKVVFKALEQVYPATRGKELHLVYGWVRLKTGKMSSRRGEVVTGEWLLDEAKKKALAILESSEVKKDKVNQEEVTEQVAVGAVKYAFLKMGLAQDLVFDFAQAVTLNGNSGPYLQYTHARCQSVIGKSQESGLKSHVASGNTPGSSTMSSDESVGSDSPEVGDMVGEEELLLRSLGHFEEAVFDAATSYAPNLVANFLYEVAQRYNTLYNNSPILKASEAERTRRLFLTKATADILKKGLYLLGISAPERM